MMINTTVTKISNLFGVRKFAVTEFIGIFVNKTPQPHIKPIPKIYRKILIGDLPVCSSRSACLRVKAVVSNEEISI
jgi:hypothetical protein